MTLQDCVTAWKATLVVMLRLQVQRAVSEHIPTPYHWEGLVARDTMVAKELCIEWQGQYSVEH